MLFQIQISLQAEITDEDEAERLGGEALQASEKAITGWGGVIVTSNVQVVNLED